MGQAHIRGCHLDNECKPVCHSLDAHSFSLSGGIETVKVDQVLIADLSRQLGPSLLDPVAQKQSIRDYEVAMKRARRRAREKEKQAQQHDKVREHIQKDPCEHHDLEQDNHDREMTPSMTPRSEGDLRAYGRLMMYMPPAEEGGITREAL